MKKENKKISVYGLAPGNVQQNMYIKHRINSWNIASTQKKFIEVGAGNGYISKFFLERGFTGRGYDLSDIACENNIQFNSEYIRTGKYRVINKDFFTHNEKDKVDIIISSHVIEHFFDNELYDYFIKCKSILNDSGRIISLVPASMKYWGIEDETVGHIRRFEFSDFTKIAEQHQLHIDIISGLTYPLSNICFNLSNHLIRKNDSWKKELNKKEQTILSSSGVKNIKYKTYFPAYFRWIINEITMFPFYILQVINRKNTSSMVIYIELSLHYD